MNGLIILTWEQDNDKFRIKAKALLVNKYIKVSLHNLTLPKVAAHAWIYGLRNSSL